MLRVGTYKIGKHTLAIEECPGGYKVSIGDDSIRVNLIGYVQEEPKVEAEAKVTFKNSYIHKPGADE
jgi:hypothetical protein